MPLTSHDTLPPALRDITIFERGWLSSNNVLLHGDPHGDPDGNPGAVLVDASHTLHASQTVQLVRHALREGETLASVVNTHLHSDHCGGNASLQRAFGCRVRIPPGLWAAVLRWDEVVLSYAPTGQVCERYVPDDVLAPGDTLQVGRQQWLALAAPGHDPHSLILFNAQQGVVISADALWERGFGVVFPELDGEQAFDEVAASLDLIESLDARWAIPGHGRPFSDVAGSLKIARERLAAFRASPERHARHAVKALVKFHMLEVQRQAWPELLAWFTGVTLYEAVWRRLGSPGGTLQAYAQQVVAELEHQGVLAVADGVVIDRA